MSMPWDLGQLKMQDPVAQKAASALVRTSGLVAVVMVANTVISIVYINTRNVLFDGSMYYSNIFSGLVISLLIPACGYFGAKNLDYCLVTTACVFSGICSLCSAVSMVGLVSSFFAFDSFEITGIHYSIGFFVFSMLLSFCLCILFSISTLSAMTLQKRLNRTIVIHVPPPSVDQTTKIDIRQPQAVPMAAMPVTGQPVYTMQPGMVASPITAPVPSPVLVGSPALAPSPQYN